MTIEEWLFRQGPKNHAMAELVASIVGAAWKLERYFGVTGALEISHSLGTGGL